MNSNFSNKTINNESVLMFAFDLEDYKEFISGSTEVKLDSFFEFLWSLEDEKYSNNYIRDILTDVNYS